MIKIWMMKAKVPPAYHFAYPTSDVDNSGGWEASPLYQKIDEEPPNDADYVYSPISAGNKSFTVGLGSLADPQNHTNHILRIRSWSGSATGGVVKFELLQTSTVIHDSGNVNINDDYVEYNFTLTAGEAANITDYAALRVRITAVTTAEGYYQYVSWVRFEVYG